MKNRWLHWFVPAVLISILFFGCGGRPGEKLYYEALSQWDAGNHVRARALLEKSISRRAGSRENADAYNRLGLLLWEMGDVQAAIDAFHQSLEIDEGQYPVLCNLGVALSATSDLPAAEGAFREAALLDPDDPRPLAYAGIVYTQNQNWKDASRNLTRALTRKPNDPKLQNALALTELHTLGTEPALARLNAIVKSNPDFAPALFNLATINRDWLKQPDEAKIWFKRYLQHSSGIDAFSAAARSQLQALNEPVGSATLSFAIPAERNRKKAELYFQRALADHRNGKTADAIKGYILAVEADDSYERAFYNLGLAYYTHGQMERAGAAFAQAVQLNPAFVDARYNLALVNHYHLGKTSQARSDLRMVLTQQPGYQPAIDLLAQINN